LQSQADKGQHIVI